MRAALAVVLVCALASCTVSPVGTGTVVALDDAEWRAHYHELDVRASLFFCGVRLPGRNCELEPELLPLDSLRSLVVFEETTFGKTCYHSPDSYLITIPAGLWTSGCVPHELGHAWLHRIGHPCASVFEHEPTTAEECSR